MNEIATAPRRIRPIWPWILLASVVLLALAFMAGASLLAEALQPALGNMNILIDGERVLDLQVGEESAWAVAAALLAGLLVLLVVLLLVVPLAVLSALLVAAVAVAAAVLAMGVVAAVALSPLWLIALMLWLALRRSPARVKEA